MVKLNSETSHRRTKIRLRNGGNFIFKIFMKIVNNPIFSILVFMMIIANTIILCLDRYPIGATEVLVLEILNEICTWFFFLEMILKLIGIGPINYARDRFNLFDASIVLLSLLEFVMGKVNLGGGISTGGAITAFRGVRLLRIFKLARSWTSFQLILKKIGKAMTQIGSFSVLLFLFMFTYTLLGMELFAH